MRPLTLLAPIWLAACTSTGGNPVDLTELQGIEVSPPEITVPSWQEGELPTQFIAEAVFNDGTRQELDLVEWSVSNRSAGAIDEAGRFTPSATNGGVTWVTARLSGIEGYAVAHVVYEQEVVPEDINPAWFDREATPVSGNWQYPADGVNLPRNTPSIHFQWRSISGADVYKLRFKSEITDTSVYVRDNEWIADPDLWAQIVSTNAGGQIEVTLSGATPDAVFEEQPITIHVNRLDADGSIIYWTTNGNSLQEIPYGEDAKVFLRPGNFGCLGCHVISSDGNVALTWDSGDGRLGVVRADDPDTAVIAAGAAGNANFKAFSPDGSLLLATMTGKLRLIEVATGRNLGVVAGGGNITHVDWSPDGSRIAFTRVTGSNYFYDFQLPSDSDSYIVTMEWFGGTNFGNEVTIADPPGKPPSGFRAYYPAFSPDGRWIAFNTSKGDAYDDGDSQLWLADADGANPPIRLRKAAPEGINTNSWPRWGPLPDDDILWLTFASRRPYGRVTQGFNPQIWVTAIDPKQAEAGEDPSFSSFWLPGQETNTANHIPMWVP